MRQIIYSCIFLMLMVGSVLGCPDGTYEYDHRALSNTGNPIGGANCTVTMNNGQSYNNLTNNDGYVAFCVNSSAGINQTQCTNPKLYNAVISDVVCPVWTYLDSSMSMSFKLSNNIGEPLEAQDCHFKVYNERGYLVQDLGTNLLYDNQTFLDDNGNYVRTAGVPLTSASGVYGLKWYTSSKDINGYYLYRSDENYTARADCNGRVVNCSFMVTNSEPLHIDDTVEWAEESAQVIVFGVAVLLIGWYFIIPAIKKGGFWARND